MLTLKLDVALSTGLYVVTTGATQDFVITYD